MKHRCSRCGDVVEYKDAPLRMFSLIAFSCGIILGITITLIALN